jgi:hypothetical protein
MALALLSPVVWMAGPSALSAPGRASRKASSMIRKIGSKYVVVSETTGRRFGTYDTRAEAERRLRQVEFFKHLKARSPRRRAVSSRSR